MVNHPTVLRGYGASSLTAGALILQRTDDSFVDGTLRDARDPAMTALLATRAIDADAAGTLKLYQPVHRVFHLAVFEALCNVPGQPRLDPAKIESAGLVVRRVARSRAISAPFGEAWMTRDDQPRGWVPIASAAAAVLDPDPAQRTLADQGSSVVNAEIQRVLAANGVYQEDVVSLFVAAPDVCAAAGRTILFALIPTSSSDTGDPAPEANPYSQAEIDANVPRFLKAGLAASIDQLAGRAYTFETADAAARSGTQEYSAAKVPADDTPLTSDSTADRLAKEMHGFLGMLKTLVIQLDAFGDTSEAGKLRTALAGIALSFGGTTQTADAFLASAASALVLSPRTQQSITFPDTWPQVSSKTAAAISSAFGTILQRRYAAFAPRATRFDDPNARFTVTAFLRATRDDGCAPELVWSAPSPAYSVAPWYDSAGTTGPALIRLPAITRANVSKLKPNVSFAVPSNLFNLLNCNSPTDLINGNGKDCGGIGLGWICGFNIPIITLCAFIVLNIFLSLFNIIFFWLPFLKICFPIPTAAPELNGGDS